MVLVSGAVHGILNYKGSNTMNGLTTLTLHKPFISS